MSLGLLPIAAILADQNSVIRRANVHYARMLGFTGDEMVGLPADMMLPAAARSRHNRNQEQFYSSPAKTMPTGSGRELSVCRKGNTTLPAEISLSVASDGDKTLTLVCIIDRTAQIAQRRTLTKTRRELPDLGCMTARGYYCGHPHRRGHLPSFG